MVTLSQILQTLQQQRMADKKKYDRYVNEGRMTHYSRDSRLAIWDTLIEKCQRAKTEKILLKDALKDLPLT